MLDEGLPDGGLGVASEEHAMWQNDRGPPGAPKRLENVEEKGVVAVLDRWPAELETAVVVLQAVAPRLDRKRRIGDSEVEGAELRATEKLWAGNRVAVEDVGDLVAMED